MPREYLQGAISTPLLRPALPCHAGPLCLPCPGPARWPRCACACHAVTRRAASRRAAPHRTTSLSWLGARRPERGGREDGGRSFRSHSSQPLIWGGEDFRSAVNLERNRGVLQRFARLRISLESVIFVFKTRATAGTTVICIVRPQRQRQFRPLPLQLPLWLMPGRAVWVDKYWKLCRVYGQSMFGCQMC